jgi:hypothetical protein
MQKLKILCISLPAGDSKVMVFGKTYKSGVLR